jgi:RND family efflux transporter MFP subunit
VQFPTLTLALCLLLAACQPEAPPRAVPPPPAVTVATPIVKPIVEWDRYTGRLVPVESVEVRARVSGQLDSIHFTEGQMVQRGDLLFVIDPLPLQATLNRAKAEYREAEARLVRSEALVRQAKAALRREEARFELAKVRAKRARTLIETKAIAAEELDTRESEVLQVAASVSTAEAAIATAEADVALTVATIASAKSTVRLAQLGLDYTTVEAPITGLIGRRNVTRGNYVNGNSATGTILTTIVMTDPVHVRFDVNEQAYLKYIRLAKEGKRFSSRVYKNPVYISLIDEVGYPHKGHMDFVDNQIDPNTGTMSGRAILHNADALLTPGLFATVRIPGSARYEAIMIPDAAIGSNQSVQFVYVVDAAQKVQPRTVKLGPLVDGLRVIRDGLKGDETIVISGLQRVRPGTVVNPQPGEITATTNGDGLPMEYVPVPESEWIGVPRDPKPTEDDSEK